ncbi:hypothetical protein BKA70DRAFT_1221875 [Coprinopsis sp. MPI-PUGE-AT-0042]|nr:hypothetical protein BKA70DRAFT_1221875 [Coprinopsis sp. MPI-PUGE-AT-0042]
MSFKLLPAQFGVVQELEFRRSTISPWLFGLIINLATLLFFLDKILVARDRDTCRGGEALHRRASDSEVTYVVLAVVALGCNPASKSEGNGNDGTYDPDQRYGISSGRRVKRSVPSLGVATLLVSLNAIFVVVNSPAVQASGTPGRSSVAVSSTLFEEVFILCDKGTSEVAHGFLAVDGLGSDGAGFG